MRSRRRKLDSIPVASSRANTKTNESHGFLQQLSDEGGWSGCKWDWLLIRREILAVKSKRSQASVVITSGTFGIITIGSITIDSILRVANGMSQELRALTWLGRALWYSAYRGSSCWGSVLEFVFYFQNLLKSCSKVLEVSMVPMWRYYCCQLVGTAL